MDQTTAVKRTGMIGLGAMGLQMARHMVLKGFKVSGYDVSADGKDLYTGEFIMTKNNMDDPGIRGKFDPDYQTKRIIQTPKYKKK